MDEKTARTYRDHGEMPSERKSVRDYRTRVDPFSEVWSEVQERLEAEPRLQAKTLLDWSVSEKANQMYNEGYAVIGIQALAKPVDHFPPNIPQSMIDNDFEWAASNRRRILKEWQGRYDSKSEPKS